MAYLAENKLNTALEAKVKHMVVEAKDEAMHAKGLRMDFKPRPPDEEVPFEEKDQRLDAIYDEEPLGFEKDPTTSSAKMMSQDPFKEVDLGEWSIKRPTYVSEKLNPKMKSKVIQLLKEHKDCFAWDYNEMPGLSRDLVELKLPIKDGKKPINHTPRRFTPEILSKIKEEI